jgi:hypothetical protein
MATATKKRMPERSRGFRARLTAVTRRQQRDLKTDLVHLPESGPVRDALLRRMRMAYLEADGHESRRGAEAAYATLRTVGVEGDHAR